MKTLLIENDPDIVANISLCLQVRWPDTTFISSENGDNGLEMVETESPDIVILDLDLSNTDRFNYLSGIRLFSDVPLIALSERSSELDKVRGLEEGADEYIVKPFSPLEFLARIKALLRRIDPSRFMNMDSLYTFGDLSINFGTRQVQRGDELVKLTPIEYKLLYYLVRSEGKVVSRQCLMEKIWGIEYLDQGDYLRKYVHRLRKKLQNGHNASPYIVTEPGVGYRLV